MSPLLLKRILHRTSRQCAWVHVWRTGVRDRTNKHKRAGPSATQRLL